MTIRKDASSGEVILGPAFRRTGSLDEFFRLREALFAEDIPEDFMKNREQGTEERAEIF